MKRYDDEDDAALDQDALMQLIGEGGAPGETDTAPPSNNTLPLTEAPRTVTPAAAPAWSRRDGARYDQWSGQGDVRGGNFANVEGFDAGNFADENMQTAKYQAGRIMSRFDPNDPNALGSILQDPEFARLFPNARGVGPDKIDFGDGRPVDVIRGHGAPGARFAWQTEDGPAGAASPTSPGSTPPPTDRGTSPLPMVPGGGVPSPDVAPAPDPDPMAAILAEIEALQQGGRSPMDLQALKQLLGI